MMRNNFEIQGDTTSINVWAYAGRLEGTRSMCAVIDTEDLPKVQTHSWYANPTRAPKGKFYCMTKLYDPETRKTRTMGLHQLVMGTFGQGHNVQVHHRNNDGLDNRKCNLEIVTHRENHRARKPAKDWQAYDVKRVQRESSSILLQAKRNVIDATGYSRAYVWKIHKIGKPHVINDMIAAEHQRLIALGDARPKRPRKPHGPNRLVSRKWLRELFA